MSSVFKILLLGLLAVVPLFISVPASSPLLEALNNSAHTVLFLGIGLSTFVIFKVPAPAKKTLPIWSFLVVLLLVIGVVIEVVQSFIGRSATLGDVVLDGLGIVAAVCFYWAWFVGGYLRGLLCGLAALALMAAFIAPAQSIIRVLTLSQQLPLICDFDRPCPELNGVDGGRPVAIGAQLAASGSDRPWLNNDSSLLRISYPVASFPGGGFDHVTVSWEGFNELCTDIYWPYLTAGRIGVHIHDKRFNKSREKFDRPYPLEAGANMVCIPLSEVAKYVNLVGVKTLVYYMPRPTQAGEFYVDNIRLQ